MAKKKTPADYKTTAGLTFTDVLSRFSRKGFIPNEYEYRSLYDEARELYGGDVGEIADTLLNEIPKVVERRTQKEQQFIDIIAAEYRSDSEDEAIDD